MTTARKNPLTFFFFIVFIIVFPLVTVFFSKSGLDRYRELKSEMNLYKDSIIIDLGSDTLATNGRLVVVGFWEENCKHIDELVQHFKAINLEFTEIDRKKIRFLLHSPDFSQDSTRSLNSYINKWAIDTNRWIFKDRAMIEDYKLKDAAASCSTAILLDVKGQVCDRYNILDKKEREKLMQDMVMVLPKKDRKHIEFRAEEKLY